MVGPQLSAVPWFDSGGWARMSDEPVTMQHFATPCPRCGVTPADRPVHDAWHDGQDRTLDRLTEQLSAALDSLGLYQ